MPKLAKEVDLRPFLSPRCPLSAASPGGPFAGIPLWTLTIGTELVADSCLPSSARDLEAANSVVYSLRKLQVSSER